MCCEYCGCIVSTVDVLRVLWIYCEYCVYIVSTVDVL